jgi:hypothetical protein
VGTLWLALVPAVRGNLVADLKNDWSDTNNSNSVSFGTWSYRQGNALLPEVPNFNFAGTGIFPLPQPAWAPSNNAGDFLPAEFKAQSVLAGADFQVGDVVVHTTDPFNGGASGAANFLWTSPINGTVTISGNVWAAVTLEGRDNSWTLLVNGVAVSSGASIDGHSRATPFDFSTGTGGAAALIQNVTVGSTIDLQITRTTSAGYFVGANLTITASAVPEPGSIVLLGLGGACFGARGWRRRLHSHARRSATR